VISYYDSQRLPATTAAASRASTTATSEAPTTTSEATATTSEASTTTIEATAATIEAATAETSTARSHAGKAAIAVAACVGSIESPGTTSEGIPITRNPARKITTAYAIGSARTKTGATCAICATNGSWTVGGTCIPRTVA
jgi:hypothetical protein